MTTHAYTGDGTPFYRTFVSLPIGLLQSLQLAVDLNLF